jgi:hypothetical protein
MSKKLEDFIPVALEAGLVTAKAVDFSSATSCALPSGATIGGSAVAALGVVTSNSANALAVGRNGATNPVFNVDDSTSSAATGINIKGAAAAAGVAVSVITSGTNENMTLDAAGSGTIGINTVGTSAGAVTIGNSTALLGAAVNGPVIATKQLRCSTVTALATTGTVSLDPTLGQVFTCTPTGAITLNAASAPAGATVYLVVTTSGSSSFNVTPTTNFKSTGALATGTSTGKVFTITFVSDGTNLNEVARTTAM